MKYPVVFNGKIREVELEGEAFFIISKSDEIPFHIKVNDIEVKVYGTSFNVSGYSSDKKIQTTLVEGKVSIEVRNDNKKIEYKLTPGQQASYDKISTGIEVKDVNTGLYTAWTSGMFVFINEPLEKILQKLSRWYDFEFEFRDENIKNECFTGELKRFDNVSKIFEMISMASDIKFETKEKNIIVYTRK